MLAWRRQKVGLTHEGPLPRYGSKPANAAMHALQPRYSPAPTPGPCQPTPPISGTPNEKVQ